MDGRCVSSVAGILVTLMAGILNYKDVADADQFMLILNNFQTFIIISLAKRDRASMRHNVDKKKRNTN